jgi:hypothetical protein
MPGMLRFVKELIKENRMTTITLEGKEYQLDIEQAKKLNLLKERDSRVESWDEFKKKYPNQFFQCLTTHESQALTAFTKLLKLRRDWIGEWEPDWKNMHASYGVIWVNKNEPKANTACTLARSLSFPDYKMATDFLETFRDLIEEAKTLI